MVVLVLVGACSTGDRGLGVLEVPDVGEVTAGTLADGHPVYIAHDLDGSVHVVEAVSAHLEDDTMAWCPSSRTIDDVFHGGIWDTRGRYVSGPGATDLGTYRFEATDEGDRVVVTEYVAPAPRSQESSGVAGPNCTDGGGYVVHPYYDGG